MKTPRVDNIRHSLAHILAMAVLKKFPKAKLGTGPVIENGFYYDISLKDERPRTNAVVNGMLRGKRKTKVEKTVLTAEDLPEIEEEMRRLVKEGLVFKGEKVTPQKARTLFKDQPFKLDLIKEFSKEKKQLTVYYTCPQHVIARPVKSGPFNRARSSAESGATKQSRGLNNKATGSPRPDRVGTRDDAGYFIDLCRGGHVERTSEINPDAFKLTHIAGAYWRGDEKNPQLTRIYGVAFETKEELQEYLQHQEEAARRDHKKLGPELDLFTFSDLVGGGLPLWTPKGTTVRNILDDFVWRLRKAQGYEQVDIPHIAKRELYEKSGHWDKFKDELFKITTREGHLFAMKPDRKSVV